MAKIKEVQFIIPIPNQPYTDARPLIEGESWEDIKEVAMNIAHSIGNEKLATTLGNNKRGKEKICTDQGCLYLDPLTHTYEDEDGNTFLSGSTFAAQFEKDFPKESVAKKVADKKLTTVDKVLEGWEMKGEVSLLYGSTVHKAVECAIKYGEIPNNPHLATLAQEFLDLTHGLEMASEQFICDFNERICGICDVLVNLGDKKVKVIDLKGLALDTLIPTPSGFTTMGEIQVGDEVYDDTGKVTKVTKKSEIHHKKCYRMEFSSGDPVIADYDHQWVVLVPDGHQKLTRRKVMTTEEIANSKKPIRIPLNQGIEGNKKELPVDPYVLGVWLGDGKRSSGEITISNPAIWDEILERGYRISPPQHDKRGEKCETRSVYGLVEQLKKAGVYKNKHIPDIYLRASKQQRLDLLAGLLDTDGSYNIARNEVNICSTKEWWVDDIKELVGSLGGRTTVCGYITKGFGREWKAKNIRIMTLFNPLGVKEIDWTPGRNPKGRKIWATRRTFEYVTACTEVESVPTQCIKVASPRHTYLFGRDFHVTHNTGDVFKKVSLTDKAKEFGLKNEMLSIYQLQLSFYAHILENMGYRVVGLEVWMEEAETWKIIELDKLNIKGLL